MARTYQLKKRAERQQETRMRIVEAAVELHSEIGPVRTTVSAIAERAGVERHTYYRHFPEERSLLAACSGHFTAVNPLPDTDRWRRIADPEARLRRALGEVYEYFERHESLFANLSRDAPVHPPTAEAQARSMGPWHMDAQAALSEPLFAGRNRRRVQAAVDVALDFATWRTLTQAHGLRKGEAAGLMAKMVACAA